MMTGRPSPLKIPQPARPRLLSSSPEAPFSPLTASHHHQVRVAPKPTDPGDAAVSPRRASLPMPPASIRGRPVLASPGSVARTVVRRVGSRRSVIANEALTSKSHEVNPASPSTSKARRGSQAPARTPSMHNMMSVMVPESDQGEVQVAAPPPRTKVRFSTVVSLKHKLKQVKRVASRCQMATTSSERQWLQKTGKSMPVRTMTEEEKQNYRNIFQLLDDDGGGTLSSEELVMALSLLGQRWNATKLEERLLTQFGVSEISFPQFLLFLQENMLAGDSSNDKSHRASAYALWGKGNGSVPQGKRRAGVMLKSPLTPHSPWSARSGTGFPKRKSSNCWAEFEETEMASSSPLQRKSGRRMIVNPNAPGALDEDDSSDDGDGNEVNQKLSPKSARKKAEMAEQDLPASLWLPAYQRRKNMEIFMSLKYVHEGLEEKLVLPNRRLRARSESGSLYRRKENKDRRDGARGKPEATAAVDVSGGGSSSYDDDVDDDDVDDNDDDSRDGGGRGSSGGNEDSEGNSGDGEPDQEPPDHDLHYRATTPKRPVRMRSASGQKSRAVALLAVAKQLGQAT